jgi:hypothetical protein
MMQELIVACESVLRWTSVVLLCAGALCLVAPRWVEQLNRWSMQQLFTDQGAMKHPRTTGLFFIAIAALLGVLQAMFE